MQNIAIRQCIRSRIRLTRTEGMRIQQTSGRILNNQ
jgi:hypothetical protein